MRAFRSLQVRYLAFALPLLALAACNPPDSGQPAPAADPAAAVAPGPALPSTAIVDQPPFAWQALAPSVVASEAGPAKLNLAGGYAYLLYPSTPVKVGDQATFKFTASGGPGGLRVVLMRHCGPGSDGDSKSEEFEIGSTPTPYTVTHTFAEAHPCLRVMFQSRDSAPNTFEIWNWELSQPLPAAPAQPAAAAPAAAPVQPATPPATAPAATTPPATKPPVTTPAAPAAPPVTPPQQ